MNAPVEIDADHLLERIARLGETGRDASGALNRQAATPEDQAGRAQLCRWMEEDGLEIAQDAVGNLYGIWRPSPDMVANPVLAGAHIDTVPGAGLYDGGYGVLAGLEAVRALRRVGIAARRPLAVAAFTNAEGVRFQPPLLGSFAVSGGISPQAARARRALDTGETLGAALDRIGATGPERPGFLQPHAYLEAHVAAYAESGPLLGAGGPRIGVVEGLDALSWQGVTIEGTAAVVGSPAPGGRNPALAAARIIVFLAEQLCPPGAPVAATVGRMRFEPEAISVMPARARFTLDLRSADALLLQEAERSFAHRLAAQAKAMGLRSFTQRLAQFAPMSFDPALVGLLDAAARRCDLACRRLTASGAHDARMMARICPSAMVLVPASRSGGGGADDAEPADLAAGAGVLAEAMRSLGEA